MDKPTLTPKALTRPARVMVAEDDTTSREYLRRALQKSGYEVFAAKDGQEAQHILAQHGHTYFDVIVTDHWMPGMTGLDLLKSIRQIDATLSSIVLTAEGEKQLVTESLRTGASDFLEKPVNLAKLLPAVQKAVETTYRLRQMAEAESSVQSLGRTQKGMISARGVTSPTGRAASVDVCFHPKQDAGGDFFSSFQPDPGKLCCLITDVSGHDLQAAYISAFFQGMVRGMVECKTRIADIFKFFNTFLINEWNRTKTTPARQHTDEISVAALAIQLDLENQAVAVLTCGTPAPYYISPAGHASPLGRAGGSALGWFDHCDADLATCSIEPGGSVLMWTDGLEDLAQQCSLHPLCLAFALTEAKHYSQTLPQLADAKDDILLATVLYGTHQPKHDAYVSIFCEDYAGSQADEIDGFSAQWQKNLQFVAPEMDESVLLDILLATREALLNGLEHGCEGAGQKKARLQISYHPLRKSFKIWVEDPGDGYEFDVSAHADAAAELLLDEHRGLIFMTHLAHAIHFERGGATVILEFNVVRPPALATA